MKNTLTCSAISCALICFWPLGTEAKHDDAFVRQTLARVIDSEKYRYDESSVDSSVEEKGFFGRMLEKIDGWISPLKKYFHGLYLATSAFAIAVYTCILAAIVVAIIMLFRRMELRRNRATFDENEKKAESLDFERELLRSKEFAQKGRFKEAVQSCIRALFLFYYHTGKIYYRKNITNREYLAILRRLGDNSVIEEIIMRGEMAIYGDEGITRDTYENLHQKVFTIIYQ